MKKGMKESEETKEQKLHKCLSTKWNTQNIKNTHIHANYILVVKIDLYMPSPILAGKHKSKKNSKAQKRTKAVMSYIATKERPTSFQPIPFSLAPLFAILYAK